MFLLVFVSICVTFWLLPIDQTLAYLLRYDVYMTSGHAMCAMHLFPFMHIEFILHLHEFSIRDGALLINLIGVYQGVTHYEFAFSHCFIVSFALLFNSDILQTCFMGETSQAIIAMIKARWTISCIIEYDRMGPKNLITKISGGERIPFP
eukprot:55553_1